MEIPDAPTAASLVISNKNKDSGVVDTTTSHDDPDIVRAYSSSTCPQFGSCIDLASSSVSNDIAMDNNENILSTHFDPHVKSASTCISFDEWRDIRPSNVYEISASSEREQVIANCAIKSVQGNPTTAHGKNFACRTCGAQFRKRRSLHQHTVQFHRGNGGTLDLSFVKRQLRRDVHQQGSTSPKCSQSTETHSDATSALKRVHNSAEFAVVIDANVINSIERTQGIELTCSDAVALPQVSPTLDRDSRATEQVCSSVQRTTNAADEIRSAPIKSLLSPTTQFRPKRRHSTAAIASLSSTTVKTDDKGGYYTEAAANSGYFPSSQGFAGLGSMMPFNFSDVSPLLRGSYLPLPLISLFLSQSALASSSLLSGATMPGAFFCGSGGPLSQQQLQPEQSILDKESMASEDERCELSTDCTSQFSTPPKVMASMTSKSGDALTLRYDGDGGDVKTPAGMETKDSSDWRATLERRMKGLTAKGTSLSKTQSR